MEHKHDYSLQIEVTKLPPAGNTIKNLVPFQNVEGRKSNGDLIKASAMAVDMELVKNIKVNDFIVISGIIRACNIPNANNLIIKACEKL